MKLITLAGQPSWAKTSVILKNHGIDAGVCKFDCLKSRGKETYEAQIFLVEWNLQAASVRITIL
ncbi:hypothetical protein [Anaerotignum sp.]|uniref:hypothetical protein n=1 Tax=Anaerotignum sp. TaxID=2039241 RepID=UPI003333C8A7